MMVLPELCDTGYVFHTRAEARLLADIIPAGSSTEAWCRAANRLGMHPVAGIAERNGEKLYKLGVNSGTRWCTCAQPQDPVMGEEVLRLSPGNLGFPGFDTLAGSVVTYVVTAMNVSGSALQARRSKSTVSTARPFGKVLLGALYTLK
ncbi:hypothetical protein LB553_29855 [Mesorhizobium sp. CA8]|nr:hypothetical protein [Mesorhizobium sp. CA8]MBZ9823520.1 hypothetical protein [Mesorhizobium sp. CA4]